MTLATGGRRLAVALLLVVAAVAGPANAAAQELAQISVPAVVSFEVADVNASTVGIPSPTRVSFANALLLIGRALRISVRAEGDLRSGIPSIPASNISWVTSNVSRGVALNGSLSTTVYAPLFESQIGATSGGVDVTWTLAAPGAPLRAGTYQAVLRWKVESFTP